MDMAPWIKMLGKTQDDAALKAALAAAGVKKIPKLDKDDYSVIFDLKGHGMSLEMTDEAEFKSLDDQDIGEGPLIFTGVDAYIVRRNSRDLYTGALPYNLQADMTRADLRKLLGDPDDSDEQVPFDSWLRGTVELIVGYTKDFTLGHVNVELVKPE